MHFITQDLLDWCQQYKTPHDLSIATGLDIATCKKMHRGSIGPYSKGSIRTVRRLASLSEESIIAMAMLLHEDPSNPQRKYFIKLLKAIAAFLDIVSCDNGMRRFTRLKLIPVLRPLWNAAVSCQEARQMLKKIHRRFPQYDEEIFGGTNFVEKYEKNVARCIEKCTKNKKENTECANVQPKTVN